MDRSRVAPISVLSGCSDEELDAVGRVASELKFATGETLMSEGDFGHSLFLVESGSADVLIHGDKVREIAPGEVVGEVAVLASGRRTASVVATSPVQVIALFSGTFGALRTTPPRRRNGCGPRWRSMSGPHLGLRRTSEERPVSPPKRLG